MFRYLRLNYISHYTVKCWFKSLLVVLDCVFNAIIVTLMVLRRHHHDLLGIFQDLDHYLQDMVYLAGNHFTLADILIYYGIHPFMVG